MAEENTEKMGSTALPATGTPEQEIRDKKPRPERTATFKDYLVCSRRYK